MRIDGACHCGEIRYEADVDPEKVALRNCTDCQTLSGSAFRVNMFVDDANLRFLSGEAVEYVKTGENGNKRVQASVAAAAQVSTQAARARGRVSTVCGWAPSGSANSWCPGGRPGSGRS